MISRRACFNICVEMFKMAENDRQIQADFEERTASNSPIVFANSRVDVSMGKVVRHDKG